MSTQVASINVGRKEIVAPASWVKRLALFVVFLDLQSGNLCVRL